MNGAFRISVRELVAFTYFPEDILPSTNMGDMLAGTLAHKARQGKQTGKAECSVKHLFSLTDENVIVYGRMDAFTDGDIPFVEEIKLSTWAGDTPMPEHRAQAVCYAAMLTQEKRCESVRFSVSYVNQQGDILREFPEEMFAADLLAEIEKLLVPYIVFAVRERTHQEQRDETLRAIPFPFEHYRNGQRELAAQVYTAIVRKKRLFASLPTGTGKSAAVLYPALKAMGEGKTHKILYLTARNTARQSPQNALERMRAQGMAARVSTLTAKEKLCPKLTRCHPDFCLRAKGHYLRQGFAIEELLGLEYPCWSDAIICQVAEKHMICPFEFGLALTELADVVLLDLNYAFDPFAQLKRLFQQQQNMTLLIDEAHHVVDRVRESLSGELDSRELSRIRAGFGKSVGRKHGYYRALTELIHVLREIVPDVEEGAEKKGSTEKLSPRGTLPIDSPIPQALKLTEHTLSILPADISALTQTLLNEAAALFTHPIANGEVMADASAIVRLCLPFLYAVEHLDEDYAILLSTRGREKTLLLYCLLPAKEIARVTKPMRGTIFFSATLTPLPAMKQLLGGKEDDACFSLPSPFPPENLAVVRRRIATKYAMREQSASAIAQSITDAVLARQGKYIAYFSSYAYLRLVLSHLDVDVLPPLWIQQREMDDAARVDFFAAFDADASPKLGMCVLGGLFSEGVDLPGERLIGVIIVGVGLPTPSARLRAIQTCYAQHFGDGFAYACRIPAMHKVLQAGGRVIRTENDKGLVLLLDERYYQRDYAELLPYEWRIQNEDITYAVKKLEEIK